MAGQYTQLIREIEIATGEGQTVHVVTAVETIVLTSAFVHDHDGDLLTGSTAEGNAVLVHGSAILSAYTDVSPRA